MTYLVKMSQREYFLFRLYVCKVKGWDHNERIDEGREFKGAKAEEWLLSTGKIKIRKKLDKRGTVHPTAYLVIKGNDDKLNEVLEACYNLNVYENTLGITTGQKTILRRDAKRTIMYA